MIVDALVLQSACSC